MVQHISTARGARRFTAEALLAFSCLILSANPTSGALNTETASGGKAFFEEMRDKSRLRKKDYARYEARFLECQRLYDEGETEKALEEMESLIHEYPKAPAEWLLLRARILSSTGDYNAAIKQCSAILKRNPKDVTALNLRGVAYSMIYNWVKGLKDVNEAISLAPDNFDAYYSKARVLMNAAREKEAETLLRDMEVKFGPDLRILSLRALSRDHLGMVWDAFTDAALVVEQITNERLLLIACQNMLKVPLEAEAWLKERLFSKEASSVDGGLLSYLYSLTGHPDKRLSLSMDTTLRGLVPDDPNVFLECYEALGYARKGLELVDSLISSGDSRADLLRERTRFLMDLGLLDEAVAQFMEVMEKDNEGGDYKHLAWMLFLNGNLPEARAAMERCWEHAPKNTYDLCIYGSIMRAMEKEEAAIAAYREAIALSERTGEILGVYYAYRAIGNREKGEAILKACMYQIDERDHKVLNLDYAYDAACYYAGDGNETLAIRYLSDVVARNGKSYGELLFDPDLKCLHELEDFKALLEKCRERAELREVERVEWR